MPSTEALADSTVPEARRKPRVLYTTPMLGYPPVGGPRLRTYATLRALSRWAEIDLFALAPPDGPDPARTRGALLDFCRTVQWPEPTSANLTPAHRVRRGAARRLPAVAKRVLQALRARLPGVRRALATPAPSPDRDPAVLQALAAWVEQQRVDLIWLGFGGISYGLLELKGLTGRPIVLETESVWSRFLLRELPFETDPGRRAAILRAGREKEVEERWGASRADVTTAVSEVDAAYFRGLAPAASDRVMLLSNVLDMDAYTGTEAASAEVSQPAICLSGTLGRGTANVDAAVWLIREIMPLVWARRPDVHVYLVGRDPAPEVRRLAGDRVHVTGQVESVVPYLRQSVASVVPLRWESGTRFKILEAFACRVPAISTTLGAEGLDVEHGTNLLLADSAPAFAHAILRLLHDPREAARLAEHGHALLLERYSLATAEQQVAAILGRLGLLEAAPHGGALEPTTR